MEFAFDNFREVIQRAQSEGYFPDAAKLALQGQIDYASARGDITIAQAQELDALMGGDIRTRYAAELEIASFGDSEKTKARPGADPALVTV